MFAAFFFSKISAEGLRVTFTCTQIVQHFSLHLFILKFVSWCQDFETFLFSIEENVHGLILEFFNDRIKTGHACTPWTFAKRRRSTKACQWTSRLSRQFYDFCFKALKRCRVTCSTAALIVFSTSSLSEVRFKFSKYDRRTPLASS